MAIEGFEYDELYYRLYLFEIVLFRVPSIIGRWLHNRGYAVEQYIGVRRKNVELELRRNFSKMKSLNSDAKENLPDDVIYNLNCLIGYFNAIEEYGPSHTVWCAEQMIKAAFDVD